MSNREIIHTLEPIYPKPTVVERERLFTDRRLGSGGQSQSCADLHDTTGKLRAIIEHLLDSPDRVDDGGMVAISEVVADRLVLLAGNFSRQEHRGLTRDDDRLRPTSGA